MNQATTTDRYDAFAQLLHWLVVVLIAVQYSLAELAEDASGEQREFTLLAQHKSVGLTLLVLAVVRVAWRLVSTPPPLPAGMPSWQRVLAPLTHWGLYLLLLVLPLSGWAMSSAGDHPVAWFGLVQLPGLVAADEGLHEALEELHEGLFNALAALAALHVAAALKHHFIDRDGLLWRMLPGPRQPR